MRMGMPMLAWRTSRIQVFQVERASILEIRMGGRESRFIDFRVEEVVEERVKRYWVGCWRLVWALLAALAALVFRRAALVFKAPRRASMESSSRRLVVVEGVGLWVRTEFRREERGG